MFLSVSVVFMFLQFFHVTSPVVRGITDNCITVQRIGGLSTLENHGTSQKSQDVIAKWHATISTHVPIFALKTGLSENWLPMATPKSYGL